MMVTTQGRRLLTHQCLSILWATRELMQQRRMHIETRRLLRHIVQSTLGMQKAGRTSLVWNEGPFLAEESWKKEVNRLGRKVTKMTAPNGWKCTYQSLDSANGVETKKSSVRLNTEWDKERQWWGWRKMQGSQEGVWKSLKELIYSKGKLKDIQLLRRRAAWTHSHFWKISLAKSLRLCLVGTMLGEQTGAHRTRSSEKWYRHG